MNDQNIQLHVNDQGYADDQRANFEMWLALNEHRIKEVFPSSVTHIYNLDNNLILKGLEECGAIINSWNDYLHMLNALRFYGFFEEVTDYQIIRNTEQLFMMEIQA